MNDVLGRILELLRYDQSQPMLFNTGLFFVLFVVFLLIYQNLHRWQTIKKLFVIAFSLYFYYKSSSWCVVILCFVCVCDYLLGLWLGCTENRLMRRFIVALNVVANVAMLSYFKYFNLLIDAINGLFNFSYNFVDIILPAGISFFTFRSISYIVDIYRRTLAPCKSLLDYTFFLTFFPPLLAGPVVRAKDMLGQIKENKPPTSAMFSEGIFLIMCGLVKKVVIADYISGNFVDRIFDNPALYTGFENLLGAIGFTIQLYCDFSGYSDMAIGLALVLGYRFKENFSSPFKSQNPTEFWRRWHISLSTWLRDYIYIPLGGNRRGRIRAYFNQFVTMVIGGLWHGASWMYIIWGVYHGLLLVLHKIMHRLWRLPTFLQDTIVIRVSNMAFTFLLIVFGFILFRASSLETVGVMLYQIVSDFHISVAPQFFAGYTLIVALMIFAFIAHMLPHSVTLKFEKVYASLPAVLQGIVVAIVIFFVIQMRQSEIVPFIYLQY